MTLARIEEGLHTAEFLLSEGNGTISREVVTIAADAGDLVPGTVMGAKYTAGSAVLTRETGATGDGALPTVTVANGVMPGRYTLTIVAESGNAGTYRLEGPDGVLIGTGNVAAAFAEGGLSFTLADGANDYDINDRIFIDVSATTQYVAYDKDNTDGSQTALAVLYRAAADSAETQEGLVIVRDAEVHGAKLTGLDAKGTADLKKVGIIIR